MRQCLNRLMAMIGLLPAALSHGIGSETQKPLAVVVIGGLITSTLLSLVVIPAAYTVIDDISRWFKSGASPRTI